MILILRIFVSSLSYNGDVSNHLAWMNSAEENGFNGLYERDFSPHSQANYPPLIMFAYYAVDSLPWVANDDYATRATLNKLTTVTVETIAMAWFFFIFGLPMFFVYLLNPGIIYNSLLWGQTEGLIAALICFSLYFLSKKKLWPSFIFLTLTLLVKQSALVFLPLFFFAALRIFGYRKTILASLSGILLYLVSFIPFYRADFLQSGIKFAISSAAGQSHYASVNALNFWYMLGLNNISDTIGFPISYKLIGWVIFIAAAILIIKTLYKKIDTTNLLIAAGLTNFAACMFLTRIHERHLLPSLVLLIPLAIKSRSNFVMYILVSLIYFYNLYLVWHGVFGLYDDLILRLFSLVLVLVFLYFYIGFTIINVKHEK